jgi:hypothetical protein
MESLILLRIERCAAEIECLQTVSKGAELKPSNLEKSAESLAWRGGRAVEGTGLENRRG